MLEIPVPDIRHNIAAVLVVRRNRQSFDQIMVASKRGDLDVENERSATSDLVGQVAAKRIVDRHLSLFLERIPSRAGIIQE